MNNGGDYVAARRALLNRYAARWLLALHNLDVSLYAALLYDISEEISDQRFIQDDTFLESISIEAQKVIISIELPLLLILTSMKGQDVKHFDQVLRLIIKLSQTSLAFTVFDQLFMRWLVSVSAKNLCRQVRDRTQFEQCL